MPLLRGGRGGSLGQSVFYPLPTVVADPTVRPQYVTPVAAAVDNSAAGTTDAVSGTSGAATVISAAAGTAPATSTTPGAATVLAPAVGLIAGTSTAPGA